MSDQPQIRPEFLQHKRDRANDAQRAADKAKEELDIMKAFPGKTEEDKLKLLRAGARYNELQHEAMMAKRLADDAFRESALNADFSEKIDSVTGDLDKSTYGTPKIESVTDDLKKSTYLKAGAAVGVVALVAIGFMAFGPKDGPGMPEEAVEDESAIEQGSAYDYDGKTYYQVFSDIPEENTGNEVCAKHGKTCVGYTALSTSVCMAFHPGAQPSEDLNGSKAGFYCNGPPQGGICAAERNTCHICPKCNLNMACDTEIGDFYRETYVECSGGLKIDPNMQGL